MSIDLLYFRSLSEQQAIQIADLRERLEMVTAQRNALELVLAEQQAEGISLESIRRALGPDSESP